MIKKFLYLKINKMVFENSLAEKSGFQKTYLPNKHKSPLRIAVTLIFSIFICEAIVMVVFIFFPVSSVWFEAFLDSVLLSILVLPTVHFLVLRPLFMYTVRLEAIDKELSKARDELEKRVRERTKDLKAANENLKNYILEAKDTRDELKHSYDTQNVINSLLRLSLEDISLNDFLGRTLNSLLSIPWLALESRGAIFLIEDNPEILIMKAQEGLSEPIKKMCKEVPLGKCFCGKAALTRKVQFSASLDERHENVYEGILPHGHYCVPILYGERVLGVINIYVKEGHIYDKKEEDFLTVVANTVVGVIERKYAEEKVKKAYDKLKETQQQLIQSEKLSALGRFSAGVAHEIKNPLGIILGGVEFLERKVSSKDADVKTTIQVVKNATLKANTTLYNMLEFAMPSRLDIEIVEASKIINETILLVKYKAKANKISINTDFANDIINISINKNQMQQVLLNIFINAIDAMPHGGEIKVSTYKMIIKDFSADKPACIIEIKDSGEGISRENLSRVFEPFFTTKRDKNGTGLGLSVARAIVRNHNGDLIINSEINKGTEVKVILPIAE